MSDAPTTPPPARMQLNIISEVALSATGEARPIHILRTGTFTSGNGYTFTFEREHLEAIEAAFAAGKRAKPPITECHDYGRAVGRIVKVWRDGDNLYAQPKWNKNGAQLLIDEVYDGFSCEVAGLGDSPTLIGGSLTNYPAVDGLQAVTLEAPREPAVSLLNQAEGTRGSLVGAEYRMPTIEEFKQLQPQFIDALTGISIPSAPRAAGGQRGEHTTQQENTRMSEDTQQAPPAEDRPVDAPDISAMIAAAFGGDQFSDALRAQFAEGFKTQLRQTIDTAREQARLEAQREIAEHRARASIETYAQHKVTPTINRQFGFPGTSDELANLLIETPVAVRAKWMSYMDRLETSGFVSFEEIGSQAEGAVEQTAKERFDAAVQAKVSTGMSQLSAIQAVSKEQPDVYASYQAESSRRGAVQRKGAK